MKAMSVKRFSILIAVLGLLGGAGFIVHEKQVERLGRNEIKEARSAFEEGEFAKAEMQFRNYLQVFPADLEIQIERADTLQKVSKTPIAQNDALQAYNSVLKQEPGRLDVRRKLMQLKIDLGRLVSSSGHVDGADFDLKILLEASSSNPKLSSLPDPKKSPSENSRDQFLNLLTSSEGELQYLLGQCYEAQAEVQDNSTTLADAVLLYQKAIEHKTSHRIEAGERCAALFRDKLKQPKEAEQVINKLVEDDASPEAYLGYLARGRYRLAIAARDQSQKALTSDADKDFEKARKLAPSKPEVYLQLAQAAMAKSKSAYNEARRILEDGLKNASFSRRFTKLWQILKSAPAT